MGKTNKKEKFVCVPCGREVIVDAYGISEESTWCCGQPMVKKHKNSKRKKITT